MRKRILWFGTLIVSLPFAAAAGEAGGFHVKAVLGVAAAKDHGQEYRVSNAQPNGLESKGALNGSVFGAALGYTWPLGTRLRLGVEADYEGRGAASDTVYQEEHGAIYSTNYQVKSELRGVASLRARTGAVLDNGALLYVTGGLAAAHVRRTYYDFRPPATAESHTSWQGGWVVGVGAEYPVSANFLAAVEFRYYDFGTRNVGVSMWDRYEKQSLSEKSVRLGVLYRF